MNLIDLSTHVMVIDSLNAIIIIFINVYSCYVNSLRVSDWIINNFTVLPTDFNIAFIHYMQYKTCLSYKTFLQRSCKVLYVNYRNNRVARVTGPSNWFIRFIHLQSLPIVFVSPVLIIAIVHYNLRSLLEWHIGT